MKNKILKKLKKDDDQVAFSIRLPLTLKTDLQTFANKNSVSTNSLITLVLEEFKYGNFSSNEHKIVTFLEMFKLETEQKIKELVEENLHNDDEFIDIYNSLLQRNAELTELIGELK